MERSGGRKAARAWDIAALCAVGGFLLFGFLTLGTYPPVNYNVGDEVWGVRESARALAEGLPHDLASPKLYFLALGLWLKLTGGGVTMGRAITLIEGAALIWATVLIGRELGGRRAGAMAALLLASSFTFCWQAGIVRHEMLSALMAAAAVLAVLRAREEGRATPTPGAGGHLFVAGLLVTLAVNVHPNNLQYALTLPVLALAALGRRMLGRPLVGGALGYGAGFAVWLVLNWLPTVAASTAAGVGDPGTTIVRGLPIPILRENPVALLLATLRAIPGDIVQYVGIFDLYFPTTVPLPVPLTLGAIFIVAAFLGPHRRGALLMVGFVVVTAFVNYLVADRFGYWHVVEFYPFLAVAAALGLDGLAARGGVERWIAPVALAAFMTLGVADTAMAVARVGGYDYNQLIGEVRAKTPPGRTLAMDLYSPAFGPGEYVGPWFGIDTPSRSCPPVAERMVALGVEYIVADELLTAFARMSCGEEYERELTRYLFLSCDAVGRVAASYPNYWVRGKLITEIYVFKVTTGSIK